MSRTDMKNRVVALVKSKLNRNYEAKLVRKVDGEEFFFKSYDRGQTYHVYCGCDLVVGDVSLDYCVQAIL